MMLCSKKLLEEEYKRENWKIRQLMGKIRLKNNNNLIDM